MDLKMDLKNMDLKKRIKIRNKNKNHEKDKRFFLTLIQEKQVNFFC